MWLTLPVLSRRFSVGDSVATLYRIACWFAGEDDVSSQSQATTLSHLPCSPSSAFLFSPRSFTHHEYFSCLAAKLPPRDRHHVQPSGVLDEVVGNVKYPKTNQENGCGNRDGTDHVVKVRNLVGASPPISKQRGPLSLSVGPTAKSPTAHGHVGGLESIPEQNKPGGGLTIFFHSGFPHQNRACPADRNPLNRLQELGAPDKKDT
ncbi:protein translocase subunit SecA [Striga asiatica]|uniref:Protein translocase subunit SecA n=1 Tax=Striga asiatica TaxID=4170 RepID=A0A5A7R6V2_STRAF|nr:protein translocase subunit SecA [Striga asiatica]